MESPSTFHDIYDYYYVPFYQEVWFIVIATLVCVVLGGFLVYWIYKKRLRPLSSWEWAMREFAKLRTEAYATKSDYKRFYFTVTTILKTYLEKRFSWDTRDKTDEELAIFLQLHGFNADLLERLKVMLQGATWIKFANEEAIKTQVEEDLKTAEFIIKKTIPTKKEASGSG